MIKYLKSALFVLPIAAIIAAPAILPLKDKTAKQETHSDTPTTSTNKVATFTPEKQSIAASENKHHTMSENHASGITTPMNMFNPHMQSPMVGMMDPAMYMNMMNPMMSAMMNPAMYMNMMRPMMSMGGPMMGTMMNPAMYMNMMNPMMGMMSMGGMSSMMNPMGMMGMGAHGSNPMAQMPGGQMMDPKQYEQWFSQWTDMMQNVAPQTPAQ